MRFRSRLTLVLLLAAPAARAQDEPAPAASIQPQARALLDAVGAKYKGLPGYSDRGEVNLRMTFNGEAQKQTAPKTFTYARPGKLNVVFEGVQFVTDGKTSTSALADKYWTSGAVAPLTPEALASNPSAVYYFGGATGIPSMAILRLLTSDDPTSALLEGVAELKVEADRALAGQPHKCLAMKPTNGPLVRLLIDPATMFLARVEVQPSPEELPPGVTIEEMSWNSGEIDVAVPPDAAFAFQPAPTQSQVDSVAELMGGSDSQGGAGGSLEGKPAPEFKCQVVDAQGKTSTLTRDDVKGKVVLIDFWATWCGPCIDELPEIAKLIKAYAEGPNADKVRVLALSIDAGDAEKLDEVRQLVETTLRDLKLDPRVGTTGLLGLDPANEVSGAFEVEAIPMLVLIDAEGIVRKVHVGLEPGIRETLTKEIDGLLQAKP